MHLTQPTTACSGRGNEGGLSEDFARNGAAVFFGGCLPPLSGAASLAARICVPGVRWH